MDWGTLLHRTAGHAAKYLASVAEQPVARPVAPYTIRARLNRPLQAGPIEPGAVLDELVADVRDGLVASVGPRYFGYVVGGVVPAALVADWMTSVWDQMAGSYVGSPAAAVVEEVTIGWLLDLFGLPADASVGFTTGSQMATFTALAAARQRLVGQLGWDIEERGLRGAPALPIVTGEERHVTVDVALRYLGIGAEERVLVACDGQGAVDPGALADALAKIDGPAIVVTQAGNVNTGAFDPFDEIADVCAAHKHQVWMHVDGAFGLWVRLDPNRAHLLQGAERADSWGTDGHKWLNVPYDTGMVFMRDQEAHRKVMRKTAAYAMSGGDDERDSEVYVPEFSRRARAFPVYAALRSLGRDGVADLIARDNHLAQRFATIVRGHPGIEVLNEVVINQVLLRFRSPTGDNEQLLDAVMRDVQEDGTFWAGRTVWRGQPGMRVSIVGWNTTEADVERAAEVLMRLLPRVA
jgi:glutamate/tyrosine decarboxylase-like PLP-dependent enzyme